MLGFLGRGPKPSVCLALASLLVFSQLISVVVALQTTAGSPCEDVCHRGATNTTSSEIVCLDRQYNSTSKGTDFQRCVECQLASTFSDPDSGESDVSWGLYNLRFAFTTCLYGYPQQMYNISSPCVVSCSSLEPALDQDLLNPTSINSFEWCASSAFADIVVDQCQFCYNLTTNQAYLGNYIEALRYNCHFRTPTGTAFPIKSDRIFTQSPLPSSSVSLISPAKHGSGVNLPVVIAVPIVCFVVAVCAIIVGCIFFIRHRRKKARKQQELDQLRAMGAYMPAWAQYPIQAGMPMQEYPMMTPAAYAPGYGYGYGPRPGAGVGFVDNDGHRQAQEEGFSKSDFVETARPAEATTTTTSSSEQEQKGKEGQTYFPPPPGAQPWNEGS